MTTSYCENGHDVPCPPTSELIGNRSLCFDCLLEEFPDVSVCYDHGPELVTDKTYRVCGECWHVFETEADLLREHNAVLEQMGDEPRAVLGDMEHFCANCIHDF